MELIFWKNIEEVENFLLVEVFRVNDGDKGAWIIVVDGQPK